jgi:hypothetical protein
MPARPASSLAARAKETSGPASAVISAGPGDGNPRGSRPSCRSRGASPRLHAAQWYHARTGPSTVVIVLAGCPRNSLPAAAAPGTGAAVSVLLLVQHCLQQRRARAG